jgi:hypothetical protein
VLPAIGVKPEAMNERTNVSESDARVRNIAGAVARRSYGNLVAFRAVRTRDVATAEDVLSGLAKSLNWAPPT